MRAFIVCVVLALVIVAAMAMPFPQNFDDAVKQAQQMSLIPRGAVVDKTFSGTQVSLNLIKVILPLREVTNY